MERRNSWIVLISALAIAASAATAQTPGPPPNQAPPNQAAPALPPQQLDNLVAPIALYPDPLLGQVLAASTYPVELVEAQQWLLANDNLTGRPLMDAARQQNWDASVQALVAMPNVLTLLTQDIRWTTDLGNAFLAQQPDVMSAVQRMRARAQANGQLQTTPQETVNTENQAGQSAIEIQPADPGQIYVPSYDPYYVYGYGAYPPLYYPDGYWFEPGINIGLYFGGWGGWGFGGWGWGWGPNWFGRGIFVNNMFFNRYGFRSGTGFAGGISGRTAWAHDPAHRLGAGYPTGALSSRFGAASQASRLAEGRSGNWHSFGAGNVGSVGNRNSFLGSSPRQATPSAGARSYSNQGYSNQNYRSQAAPTQRYQSPQSYQSPRQSQPSYQQAPRASAPARSSGGGGGASRSSGGGHGGGGRR